VNVIAWLTPVSRKRLCRIHFHGVSYNECKTCDCLQKVL